MIPVQVVGLGMGVEDLSPRARGIIETAEVLAGGSRHLGYFPDHPARKITLGKEVRQTLALLQQLAATRRVVVLASGDPNFYGIGPLVVEVMGPEAVHIHPNLTAVQAAAARLRIPWQEAAVVSLHGRGDEALSAALGRGGTIFVYTDRQHTPAWIGNWLRERGWDHARLAVLEDLGQDGERIRHLRPAEAAGETFSDLNMVVMTAAPAAAAAALHLGMPEEALAHEAGLITKAEVRAVALAKLRLGPGQTVWDIGAGSGSVSLEASLLTPGGRIFAVEQQAERAAQIEANLRKFRVTNLEIVCGRAPECLDALPDPDRVFVGGGGQDLPGMLAAAGRRLTSGGRLVVTAALWESLNTARGFLEDRGWETDLCQVQVSRARRLGASEYLQALNPIWIIAGQKGSD